MSPRPRALARRASRHRTSLQLLALVLVGTALYAAPAPAQEGGDTAPWFEHARVDLMATGGYDRELTAPPAEHEPDTSQAPDDAGVEPGGEETGGGAGDGGGTGDEGDTTDSGPGPGWSSVAELPIAGQFVVLEWDGDPAAEYQIRSRNAGEWTEWVDAHVDGDERPDASEPGFEGNSLGPIFVGDDAEAIELVIEDGHPEDLSLLVMESHEPEGYVEPSTTTPAGDGRNGGRSPGAGGGTAGTPAPPPIFTRAQWGAGGWAYGNPGCGNGPTMMSSLRFAVVHHTVSTNDYSASQADDQIRAIYDYHVNGRGWCDIAYNFVVDRFGTVWEGRTNSISGPVQGGHASGFNTGSMGVVLLGQYHPGSSPPATTVSSAQYGGVRDLIAWKFGVHGIDALGTTTEVSGGSTSIPAGTQVTLRTISGHRDVGSTGCPGDNAYVLLPGWRTDVAAKLSGAPSAATRPGAAKNADGRMEVFATGNDGTIFHGWQSKPNQGPWTGWYPLNSQKFVGGVSVTPNKDGRLQVFARASSGAVQTSSQTTPNGIWGSFSSIGGNARSTPAAGTNQDGRLEAYYTGNDGLVWHNWQWAPAGSWSGWSSLGGSFTNAPAVGRNRDGRQELAVVGNDGQLYHSWQQVPNGGWSPWYSLGGTLKGDAAIATNVDGRVEMFAVGTDGQLWHNWQWKPNGTTGWSGWYPMGGTFSAGPAVNINIDGRLELFTYGSDGKLWNNWQVVAGGGWSGWHPLSSKLR